MPASVASVINGSPTVFAKKESDNAHPSDLTEPLQDLSALHV